MDGGGRVLRSLGEAESFLDGARLRFASPFALLRGRAAEAPKAAPRLRGTARRPWTGLRLRRGYGTALLALLFGATGLYGAVRGGEYAGFVADYGSPADVAANLLGFSIRQITISGVREMTPREILDGGAISPKTSLAFLDPVALRDRLRAIPLVKDATISKFFPGDLSINVTERDPAALWQGDGAVSVVAVDGVPIDGVRDDRFNALPFVVGKGANEHLGDYLSLLMAAGDLADRVRSGIFVGERRWTFQMESGVQVELPETGGEEAVRRLAELESKDRILEKDVVSLDLRIAGRITARLSEDAAATRAAALAKKSKAKADPG